MTCNVMQTIKNNNLLLCCTFSKLATLNLLGLLMMLVYLFYIDINNMLYICTQNYSSELYCKTIRKRLYSQVETVIFPKKKKCTSRHGQKRQPTVPVTVNLTVFLTFKPFLFVFMCYMFLHAGICLSGLYVASSDCKH